MNNLNKSQNNEIDYRCVLNEIVRNQVGKRIWHLPWRQAGWSNSGRQGILFSDLWHLTIPLILTRTSLFGTSNDGSSNTQKKPLSH